MSEEYLSWGYRLSLSWEEIQNVQHTTRERMGKGVGDGTKEGQEERAQEKAGIAFKAPKRCNRTWKPETKVPERGG